MQSAHLPPHHSVSILARPSSPEHFTWPSSSPSKAARPLHRPPGRARDCRHGAGQRHDPVAHRIGGDDDPGGRQPPDLVRRQAAAPDAHAGDGPARRLRRRRPRQARRRGRVHAHRHAVARRRGGRERDAARPARRPHALGQRGERAGRRFPARPGVQDDGRGRPRCGRWRSSRPPPPSSPRARSCSSAPPRTPPPPRTIISR